MVLQPWSSGDLQRVSLSLSLGFLRSLLPVSPLFSFLFIQIRFQFLLSDSQKEKSAGAGAGPG